MRRSNRWKEYCETTFNSLNANIHNWGKKEFYRPLTRIFYMGVFDCGTPNHTGFISQTAYNNKLEGNKTVHDHYLSPQFIGRMILDNPDKYLSDFNVFRDLFWKSCGTVVVTAEENIKLSKLTENNDNYYKVFVPTDKKYEHVGIKLLSRPDKKQKWKGVDVVEASTTDLYFPDDLIEYEKDYLVIGQKQPVML